MARVVGNPHPILPKFSYSTIQGRIPHTTSIIDMADSKYYFPIMTVVRKAPIAHQVELVDLVLSPDMMVPNESLIRWLPVNPLGQGI